MKNLFLLFAALCCTVMANAQTTQPNDEIWYTTTDGKILVPKNDDFGADIMDNFYDDEKGCWVIKFNQPVTNIGYDAFCPETFEENSLTSVSIPASVRCIEQSAFQGSELKTLTFAAGSQLESIGGYAFAYSGISGELTIPASVTVMEESVFGSCSKLSKVYMSSEDLSGISKNAFDGSNISLYVPPYLHEKYRKYFAGYSNVTVETSLDDWKTYMIEPIKADFETLTLISPSDKTWIKNIIDNLYNASDVKELDQGCDKAKEEFNKLKEFENHVKNVLGSMGTKQSGPAVEIMGKDGQTIQLYNIENVKFIKVEE